MLRRNGTDCSVCDGFPDMLSSSFSAHKRTLLDPHLCIIVNIFSGNVWLSQDRDNESVSRRSEWRVLLLFSMWFAQTVTQQYQFYKNPEGWNCFLPSLCMLKSMQVVHLMSKNYYQSLNTLILFVLKQAPAMVALLLTFIQSWASFTKKENWNKMFLGRVGFPVQITGLNPGCYLLIRADNCIKCSFHVCIPLYLSVFTA